MKLHKAAHTVYKSQYHIVCVTRYRRKILVSGVEDYLRKVYLDEKDIWGRGFFVSNVGINEAIIQQYIRYQGKQDTGQAQLEC